MKEKNPAAVLLGKASAKSRFKGKGKREITIMMRELAKKRIYTTTKTVVHSSVK